MLDVWQWVSTLEGLSAGFSRDSTGRALNALTHLSTPVSQQFALFWMLMGLEALYVKGSSSVMEQLRERIYTLLGTPKGAQEEIQ